MQCMFTCGGHGGQKGVLNPLSIGELPDRGAGIQIQSSDRAVNAPNH